MIALLRQVADPGSGEGGRWAGMRTHRILTEMMTELGYSSKLNAERAFLDMLRDEGRRAHECLPRCARRRHRAPLDHRSRRAAGGVLSMGLVGILLALVLLMWLAYKGWSVLLLAPAAALLAAAISREPLLANWTQTFMGSAAQFVAQFFPLFLLGALFGKLMDDSGSVAAIAKFMTERLGTSRAVLAVVLAGSLVTYGGVSVFVAFFVLVPMAQVMFKAADIPRRLMPATVGLGTLTFTMSAFPGTPAIQNAIPMPFFGTTPFAAPGLGIIASVIMLGFGLWWLGRAEARARKAGEGFGPGGEIDTDRVADDQIVREHAITLAREFDPAEIRHGRHSEIMPSIGVAVLPLARRHRCQSRDVAVRPAASRLFVSRRRALGWNHAVRRPRRLVGGDCACGGDPDPDRHQPQPVVVIARNHGCGRECIGRCRSWRLRASSVSARSLPRCPPLRWCARPCCRSAAVRWFRLPSATNVLAALTGSASGGMTIALDALGATYLSLAAEQGINPALLHRVAVMASATLDTLPHNGAIVTLLAVCGTTHRESYFDIVMVAIVGAALALAAVIMLGTVFGSF